MIVPVTDAVPPLGLARYRALFRVPYVRRLVLSGLLARLPIGMVPLALLLLVRENGGSYAAAGAVSGAFFVAAAVVRNRLRARGSLQEIFFIVGPLLVALLTAAASPVAALVVAAAAGGAGTVVFALTQPVRAWKPEEERHAASALGALESPGVRTIIFFAVCLGLGFGGTEIGMPAFAEDHGGAELGSIPIALFAGGSLVGGLVAGARVTSSPRRLLRLSTALLVVGLTLPLLAWSLPALAVLAFAAGLPIAPTVMAAYGLIDAVARRGTAAEAFAWISTAVSAGVAAGTAAGGALVDAYGVRASFTFGCAAVLAGAVVASVGPGLESG